MSEGFHVATDPLRDHAIAVADLASRAGTAADAGGQVSDMHAAYGLLCWPIGKILAGPQQRCADSLGQTARAMRRIRIDRDTDVGTIYRDPYSLGGGLDEGGEWEKGLTAIEACEEIGAGISNGDWAKIALGGAGAGLDTLSAGFDPVGYFSGQLTSWMMEHLEPLRKVLHGLTGEPDMVKGYATSWGNISREMGAVSGGYAAAADGTSGFWNGPAGDASRSQAHHVSNLAKAAAGAADTLTTAATMAGELVAGIRTTVRDVIAALVEYLVDLVAEEACTVGPATPVVAAQGVEEIGRASCRIGESLTKLGKAISDLAGWLVALRDMLDGLYAELSALAEDKEDKQAAQ